jgi:hypothetical protein
MNMANTKKEWRNMTAFEKVMQIFVNVAALAVALVVTIIAYWVPVDCNPHDLDKGVNIYCLTHPGTVADVIGMVLLWFGCFWLSGIWGYFVQDDDEDPWKRVTRYAWLCAIAGPALITLF